MKNVFCFSLKPFFVLKIFIFLSWLSGHEEKQTDEKYMVNFKIYDITNWETHKCNTRIIQCLKKQMQSDNEILSFNKIYNMRNIIFEKPNTRCGGESSPRPDLWISCSKFMQFVFILYQVESYWKILKLICRLLTITSHKAFLKNIKMSETCYILLPDQI